MTDILVSEVGPRDGLQSIKAVLPTEAKKAWSFASDLLPSQSDPRGRIVQVKRLSRVR